MAFKRVLVANGMPVNMADALRGASSVSAALTGAGTTVADALAASNVVNVFGTVASGAGSLLPTMEIGDEVTIVNLGANALKVWPAETAAASGAAINLGAADAAFSVASGKVVKIQKVSALQYVAVLSA